MEGDGPPPWTPLLGLGFEIPSRGCWEAVALTGWKPHASPCWCSRTSQGWGALPGWSSAPPGPPALGDAVRRSSLSWRGFVCSKSQIPPWEPRWLGLPCQVAQAFTTRRQAGSRKGWGNWSPCSPEGAGGGDAAVTLRCLRLAGCQGDTSGTSSHTLLAHPAWPRSCKATGP